MSRLACRNAALAIALLAALIAGARAADAPAPSPAFGRSGFDAGGADLATNPGDGFFRYGNGAWYDRAVIPADRSATGIDTALTMTAEGRVRDILERGPDGVGQSERADATKFGAFYAAFMDAARAEARDATPIAPLVATIRAVTTHDEMAELMGRRSFFFSLFGLGIGPDDKAPDRYSVSVRQGGLGLNRDYYLVPRLADKKAAYLAYMADLLAMIGWEAPAQAAAAILDFETQVAEVSWSNAERRDPDKTYNPMSVAALAEAAPFPWRRLLASSDLGDLDHVVVVENTALPKIAAAFARAPLDTLKAWQAFHLVDAAAPYLSQRFVAANFGFRSRTMSGIAEQPQRWRRAVTTINGAMGQAIGRAYVARYFPPEAKAQVDDLVTHMRAALKERITQLDWMGPETRRKALEKLARLDARIAYPNRWRDYSALDVRADDLFASMQASRKFAWLRQVTRLHAPVDRDDWYLSPHTVNASYNSSLNDVTFPAGILQPPYFDPAADPAVNYGGIGAVIGHEMIHGYDDEGRKYDGEGVLTSWWTDADAKEFVARAAVLGRQFDGYEPFPGVHLKGDLTMGENIADLGGALVALDAYHLSLGGKPAPVIDGLTGDQRFFLSYAQSWRHKSTEAALRQQIVSNSHAPAQYRVDGVVRNMDAWYAAFNIRPGDKLYLAPGERARIW